VQWKWHAAYLGQHLQLHTNHKQGRTWGSMSQSHNGGRGHAVKNGQHCEWHLVGGQGTCIWEGCKENKLPEGADGGPKWVCFWKVPRVWAPLLALLKFSIEKSPCLLATQSSQVWEVPIGAPMPNQLRRGPYFSPPFCHISPPTDPICVIVSLMECIHKISLQNKWSETAELLVFYRHFRYFPLEITALGFMCTMCA
jgi:hypothetical protein